MFILRDAGGASTGGAPQPNQQAATSTSDDGQAITSPAPAGDSGQPPAPQGGTAGQFTAEQQAAVEKIVAERLERERRKQQAAIDKAKADAEAAGLAEQGKYKELYEKAQAEAKAAAEELARIGFDQQRREAAQAAGIPHLWQRLQGATAEELAVDAKALAAMVQPAGQRSGSTMPTPQPQTTGQSDYVKQAIDRQQKRATDNDPFAAMMKR